LGNLVDTQAAVKYIRPKKTLTDVENIIAVSIVITCAFLIGLARGSGRIKRTGEYRDLSYSSLGKEWNGMEPREASAWRRKREGVGRYMFSGLRQVDPPAGSHHSGSKSYLLLSSMKCNGIKNK
jgi:hypothetical protein